MPIWQSILITIGICVLGPIGFVLVARGLAEIMIQIDKLFDDTFNGDIQ